MNVGILPLLLAFVLIVSFKIVEALNWANSWIKKGCVCENTALICLILRARCILHLPKINTCSTLNALQSLLVWLTFHRGNGGRRQGGRSPWCFWCQQWRGLSGCGCRILRKHISRFRHSNVSGHPIMVPITPQPILPIQIDSKFFDAPTFSSLRNWIDMGLSDRYAWMTCHRWTKFTVKWGFGKWRVKAEDLR
jgi:hypothetical protein